MLRETTLGILTLVIYKEACARGLDRVESLQANLPGPPENSTHIYFRDVILPASDDESGEDDDSERESCSGTEGEGSRRMARRRLVPLSESTLPYVAISLPLLAHLSCVTAPSPCLITSLHAYLRKVAAYVDLYRTPR